MIGEIASRLADLAWPPVCPVTGGAVDASGRLQAAGWARLTFLDAPWCGVCGLPFPYPGGSASTSATLCALCVAKQPVYDLVRAPLAYDDASRPLVLGFKHGSRREMIDQFARWMIAAGRDGLDGADAILPVLRYIELVGYSTCALQPVLVHR